MYTKLRTCSLLLDSVSARSPRRRGGPSAQSNRFQVVVLYQAVSFMCCFDFIFFWFSFLLSLQWNTGLPSTVRNTNHGIFTCITLLLRINVCDYFGPLMNEHSVGLGSASTRSHRWCTTNRRHSNGAIVCEPTIDHGSTTGVCQSCMMRVLFCIIGHQVWYHAETLRAKMNTVIAERDELVPNTNRVHRACTVIA